MLVKMRSTTACYGRFGAMDEGAEFWTDEPDAQDRELVGVAERIDPAEAGEAPDVPGIVVVAVPAGAEPVKRRPGRPARPVEVPFPLTGVPVAPAAPPPAPARDEPPPADMLQ